MRRLAVMLAAVALAGCAGGSGGAPGGYSYPYAYDDDFRYGLWRHHHDVDVDVTLPDRPRPPVGTLPPRPNRPTTLPARVPPGHATARPASISRPIGGGGRVGRGAGARAGRR